MVQSKTPSAESKTLILPIAPSSILPVLPDEIWIKTFKMLNMTDLLSADLVCKKWHELISNSSAVLRNIKFEVHLPKWTPVYEEIINDRFRITRKYHHVKITSNSDSAHDVSELGVDTSATDNLFESVSTNVSSSLTILTIRSVRYDVASLLGMLSQCQVLHSLTLAGTIGKQELDIPQTLKPIKIPSLKKLYWSMTSFALLELFDCTDLQTFLVYDLFAKRPADMLIKFLNKLTRLDELSLQYVTWSPSLRLEPKFRWRKLEISNMKLPETTDDTYKMAITNAEILGKASVKNGPSTVLFEKNASGMESIMSECNATEMHLKKVLDVDQNKLPPMQSIRKLTLTGDVKFKNVSEDDSTAYTTNFAMMMFRMSNLEHLICEKFARMANIGLIVSLNNNLKLLEVTRNSLKTAKGLRSDDTRKFLEIYYRTCYAPVAAYKLTSGNKWKPAPVTMTKAEFEMKHFDRALSQAEREHLCKFAVGIFRDFSKFNETANVEDWITWMNIELVKFRTNDQNI